MEQETTYTETEFRNLIAGRINKIKRQLKEHVDGGTTYWFLLGKKTELEDLLIQI